MEGKLIKNKEHHYLTVNGNLFAEIGGHPLKSINQALSLKNCEAIENGYDLDELAWKEFPYHEWEYSNGSFGDINEENRETFKIGFQKALEILGDKKFSEEDMEKCFNAAKILDHISGCKVYRNFDSYLRKSLQQTEWDVEIEMEEIPNMDYKPSFGGGSDSHYNPMYVSQPKLDSEGCLILRRK